MKAREQREGHGESVDGKGEAGEPVPDALVRRRRVARAGVGDGEGREQCNPDNRQPVQRAGEDAGKDRDGECRDPDSAMDPQADDGNEEQQEWEVGL